MSSLPIERSKIMTIKTNDIEIKYNPRTTFEGIDELARSIRELGILQPLAVSRGSNGKYVLLDGQRRLLACKKLGLAEVPVIERDLNESQQKEVPIATDFFKDKLKISEKIIGVANLINKEQKVTDKVLAKRYGWSVAEVRRLLKLAILHPKVLNMLDNEGLKVAQALELTRVKREDMQIKLADAMSQRKWYGLLDALEDVAFELPFDDVFNYEEAKKDKKIGIAIKDEDGNEHVFTYDEGYYKEKREAYDGRMKSAYHQQEMRVQSKEKKVDPKTPEAKEQRKKERQKAQDAFALKLGAFRDGTLKFLSNQPTGEDVSGLLEKFIRGVSMDNCKLILKAFEVPFKASEMQSADYKEAVVQLFSQHVKTELQLIKLIQYVDLLSNTYKTTMFEFDGLKKMIVQLNK